MVPVNSLFVTTDVSDERVLTCNEDRSDAAPDVDQSDYQDEGHGQHQQSASAADMELKEMRYQSLQYQDSAENGNVYEVIRA